ncbi:MAG TPA: hypothetical protein VMR52_03250 [Dehalococcoidia bacterium]|nr:hypothetical protein [Dehalococcoidia bacterium]
MLLFRSEEHVARWLEQRQMKPGSIFTVDQGWSMARIWYGDRLSPEYRRPSAAEAEAIFAKLGLGGDFWKLSAD